MSLHSNAIFHCTVESMESRNCHSSLKIFFFRLLLIFIGNSSPKVVKRVLTLYLVVVPTNMVLDSQKSGSALTTSNY